MKHILCVAFAVLYPIQICLGQRIISSVVVSPNSTYIRGNNFEGAIFSSQYNPDMGTFNVTQEFRQYQTGLSQRFTPSFAQIELAERVLQKNLRRYNRRAAYQGKGFGPIIHKHLDKYRRQYFGYTSINNEPILFINAGWERSTLIGRLRDVYPRDEKWKSDYQIVMDGGSYYWRIEVNLTTGKLSDLSVNGVASFWPNTCEFGEHDS